MKSAIPLLKYILLLSFLTTTGLPVQAQKLPRIQKQSVFAPSDIAVDGKATEWNNKFQAYNTSTEVYYAVANDTNMFYITLQASNPDVIRKIIAGGITFSFSKSEQSPHSAVVTFPAYNKSYPPLNQSIYKIPLNRKDTLQSRLEQDSAMNVYNNELKTKLKLIGIRGVKEIKDSLLSIYNEEGIRAAAAFDANLDLTYELGLPLHYLGFDSKETSTIFYQVKLNGIYGNVTLMSTARGDMIMSVGENGRSFTRGLATPQKLLLGFDTSFSGEYTLANK